MSHNRFPDGPRGENSVNRNIFDYIRIVVLDINLEDVELEMLNLGKQEFVFFDTSNQDNPVLIERHSSQRPFTRTSVGNSPADILVAFSNSISILEPLSNLKRWPRSW